MSKSSKLKQIKSLVGKSGIYIGSKENGKKKDLEFKSVEMEHII